MQHCCLHTKCFQCDQLSYNSTMDEGMHADKLNASVGCRQIVASIGCSIILCIQSNSNSCNYCCCMQNRWMQSNLCQYWMQHYFLHPKCFRFPQLLPLYPLFYYWTGGTALWMWTTAHSEYCTCSNSCLAAVWWKLWSQDVREMWRVERLVYHDFIPNPLGPSAR